jgi:hypothetical protein
MGKLLGLFSNTTAASSSHRAMPRRWLTLYDYYRMRQRRCLKWAAGREQCWTCILRGRKRSGDGADCSITSINPAASERQIKLKGRRFN